MRDGVNWKNRIKLVFCSRPADWDGYALASKFPASCNCMITAGCFGLVERNYSGVERKK